MRIIVLNFNQHVVRAVNNHAAAGPSIRSIDGDASARTGEAVRAGRIVAAADNSASGDIPHFKFNMGEPICVGAGCLHIGECAADSSGGRVAHGERGTIEPGKVGAA